MAAYLQFGHDSWNLVDETGIGEYCGIVLSPVNDSPLTVVERLKRLGSRRDNLEVILDPQLYNPNSGKGTLGEWGYFPEDFETANKADISWWKSCAQKILENAKSINANSACSPAFIPKVFSLEYYQNIAAIADHMKAASNQFRIDVLFTAIIKMSDLADPGQAMKIASVISSSDCDRVYLFFLDDSRQRGPYKDTETLATAVHLIRLLSVSMRVQVAFSGHDLVLWKSAGAQDIASGKWLNVRRFSPGRWSDEETGGRQVTYWNEGSLLTLLRDADVQLLDSVGFFLNEDFSSNPYSKQILDILRSGSGAPWLKLSWCQYLRWVFNTEAALNTPTAASSFVKNVDDRWKFVEENELLFQDRPNDGSWIRPWLNAIKQGSKR